MPKLSCNAFYMFMMHVKRREEQSRGVRLSFDDIYEAASSEWKRMAPGDKHDFKARSREYKSSNQFREARVRRAIQGPPKKHAATVTKSRRQMNQEHSDDSACNGVSDLEDDYDDEPLFYNLANDDDKFWRKRERDRNSLKIALASSILQSGSLAAKASSERFHVLIVQNYFETPEHDCSPAEMAIVEFSLVGGIAAHFHAILKPHMLVPQGNRRFVEKSIAESHKISMIRTPPEARDDYAKVAEEIVSFCARHATKVPFQAFVVGRSFNTIRAAVETLRGTSGSAVLFPIDTLACVEDLYTALCNFHDHEPEASEFVAFNELCSGKDFVDDSSVFCEFHRHAETNHCALAIAKNVCYLVIQRLQRFDGMRAKTRFVHSVLPGQRLLVTKPIEFVDCRPPITKSFCAQMMEKKLTNQTSPTKNM